MKFLRLIIFIFNVTCINNNAALLIGNSISNLKLFSGGQTRADLSSAKIFFYYGPLQWDNVIYNLDDSKYILTHPKYDPNKLTTLYLHGYSEKQTDESINVIVSAYYSKIQYHNLLVLDWEQLSGGSYLSDALPNTRKLSKKLAEVLLDLFNQGLNIKTFHLVGHSLGAQLAGMVGRNIIEMTSGQVILPRISGLDPAFPGFYIIKVDRGLNPTDAEFVDIIHTDAGFYGAPYNTGTADFWPNGGRSLQPGCPKRNFELFSDNDLCCHRRSWRFWAESVADEYSEKFLSVPRKNWFDFKYRRSSADEQPVLMGIFCPPTAQGSYYFQTNGEKPYGKGYSGTQYVLTI